MTIPAFEKLGPKLDIPNNDGFFPTLFENDAVRANLPNVPGSTYSLLFSTDHSPGAGHIYRVDFDQIEGEWTLANDGEPIHTGEDQRETPQAVYDAFRSRINVYVHDSVSSFTADGQATRLLTTTDLALLTDEGETGPDAQHSGYLYARHVASGAFSGHMGLIGTTMANSWLRTRASSVDGEQWSAGKTFHSRQHNLFGENEETIGPPFYFEWQGNRYLLTSVRDPFVSEHPTRVVAIPVASDEVTPIGPAITLLETTAGAFDETIRDTVTIYEIGGALYLLYVGISAGGDWSICLAKSTEGVASVESPRWPVDPDGAGPVRHTKPALSLSHDFATDGDLPAWMTVQVGGGSDQSSHNADDGYYEVNGPFGDFNLLLRTVDSFNPTDYEAIEVTFRGVTFNEFPDVWQHEEGQRMLLGWRNVNGTELLVSWRNTTDSLRGGELIMREPATVEDEEPTRLIPYSRNPQGHWARSRPRDFTFRIHDYGRRLTIFVDDSAAFHIDLDEHGYTWADQVFPMIQAIRTPAWTHTSENPWIRVQSIDVSAYVIAPVENLAAIVDGEDVNLEWTHAGGSKLDSIRVYRSDTEGVLGDQIASLDAGDSVFVDGSLEPGTHWYTVSIEDDDGQVALSDQVSASISPPPDDPQPTSAIIALQDAIADKMNQETWPVGVTARRDYIPIAPKDEIDKYRDSVLAVIVPDDVRTEDESRGGDTMTVPVHIAIQGRRDPGDVTRGDSIVALTEQIEEWLRRQNFLLDKLDPPRDAQWVSSTIQAPWDWQRLAFHHAWLGLIRAEYQVRV